MRFVEAKWRPSLGMIAGGVIAFVLILPLIGLLFFRLFENQLVRQAESELIGQAAILREYYAEAIARAPEGAFPTGPVRPFDPAVATDERYAPISASLDLTRPLLDARPAPQVAQRPLPPATVLIGERLTALTQEAQKTTLAGFRFLDADGTVIAGREDVGLSFADVPEVQTARAGRFASVLRMRDEDVPKPPLYSISRGTNIRVFVAMPVFVENRVRGVIYVSRTPDNILRQLYRERGKVALAALLAIMAAAAIWAVFVRAITRPLRDLAQRAEAITRGDRAAIGVLSSHGTREVAGLSQSFMTMAKRLSERSDYLTTFASHVTHELKTPLTSMRGAIELLRESGESMNADERARFLANASADVDRMAVLLDRLRELARADNPALGGSVLLSELGADLRVRFATPVTEIEAEGDPALPMSLENAVIVFGNLADNAAKHGARHVRITTRADDLRLVLRVADDGPGVSEGNRARIFEPFFTTRRAEGGAGMGLGIARAMLRAHGGEIVLAESSEGAAFEITLPRVG